MARIIDLSGDTPEERAARRERNSKNQTRSITRDPRIHRPKSVSWASRERAIENGPQGNGVTKKQGIDEEMESSRNQLWERDAARSLRRAKPKTQLWINGRREV